MCLARSPGLAALTLAAFTLAAGTALADDKADKKKARQALKKKLQEQRKLDAAKPVEPAKPAEPPKPAPAARDSAALTRLIDAHIDRALAENKLTPSPTCSDADFLRRAYLDLTGVIPTAAQARAFLDDPSPGKRAKLIDELLAGPNYGRHMADVWMGLLVQRTSDNRRVNFDSLRTWLADRFNRNAGWDRVVTDLVTASGRQEANPAVGFYLSNNTVDKMTDEVGKLFLGVQLQCAQCHDHPFTAWKQNEYWAMARFFMKVQVGGLGKDQSPGIQEVTAVRRNKFNMLPEAARTVPAKFLQGDSPTLAPADPHRPVLAEWLTAAGNPFFARAMVNRTWAQLFGRGFVDPVDDMHAGNEPSHPGLLAALADDFAATGFDLKHLVRAACNSKAYQRSSKPTAGNEADDELFARMAVKVLTPEQLYDSLTVVTGPAAGGGRARDKAVKGYQPGARDRFVQFFLAGADQASTTEYEAGIPQALKLMNSRQLGNPAAVRQLTGMKPAEAVETLYLATLARRPTTAEAGRLADYVSKATTPAEAYGDILWALLNSSEFAMVR
jgi:hypothetical protein